jgi:hypothetical protein
VDLLGEELGLPKALSGHNAYYTWGPRDCSGECIIAVGIDEDVLRSAFGSVLSASTVVSPNAKPGERLRTIYVCREPVNSLQELWPRFKTFL